MYFSCCYVGIVVMGGKLFVIGGYDGLVLLDFVERYDLLLQEWILVSVMIISCCDMGVVVFLLE